MGRKTCGYAWWKIQLLIHDNAFTRRRALRWWDKLSRDSRRHPPAEQLGESREGAMHKRFNGSISWENLPFESACVGDASQRRQRLDCNKWPTQDKVVELEGLSCALDWTSMATGKWVVSGVIESVTYLGLNTLGAAAAITQSEIATKRHHYRHGESDWWKRILTHTSIAYFETKQINIFWRLQQASASNRSTSSDQLWIANGFCTQPFRGIPSARPREHFWTRKRKPLFPNPSEPRTNN